MSEILKPIKEQEEVMGVKDNNLIISASAGSGKTTIMIRKILQAIVEDGVRVNEILVLTYTDSASGEMKKKLIEKLKNSMQEHPFLIEELEDAESADISTFDSFCQKLVKKYFYVLNIDPSFSALVGGDEKKLKEECMADVLKHFKKTEPNAYENLIFNLSKGRSEENIKKIVFEINNYLLSILNADDFWSQSERLYDGEQRIAENYLCQHYNRLLKNYIREFEDIRQVAISLNIEPYIKVVSENIAILEGVMREPDFIKKMELLGAVKLLDVKIAEGDEIELYKKISALKKDATKVFGTILGKFGDRENIEKSYKNCEILVKNLKKLTILFQNEYFKAKTQNNTFDFNDIERFTIKLLENEDIRQEVKSQYKKIYIDEYQDANAIQERIINLIKGDNNLFFVGDTKQSIYAFRQSNPEIFLNTQKYFEIDSLSQSKTLNCNFRTNKNILEFANCIFSIIMTEDSADLNYQKNAQFVPKAEYLDLENETCVEIDVLKKPFAEIKLNPDKVYSVKEHLRYGASWPSDDECALVGQKIIEILGTPIYDKETLEVRPATFSDITILLRKRGAFLNNLIKEFKLMEIPFIVNVNDELEDYYDNNLLYNAMKLALNYQDDHALYFVLSSALFNFSNSDFAFIRERFLDKEYFYEAVAEYLQLGDELANRLNKAKQTLDEFALALKYKGVYIALNDLLENTNYLINISAEDNFTERKLNIDEFIASFEGSIYDSKIEEYVLYRELSTRGIKRQSEKTFTSAVEITTMHSSKGLEYPIVILPNLSGDISKEVGTGDIKINKNLGIGIKAYNADNREVSTGIFFEACRLQNKKYDLGEAIRLLYVAMTRAKNRLIITGVLNAEIKKIQNNADIKACKSYLQMVLGSLDTKTINALNAGDKFSTILYDNPKLKLNFYEYIVREFLGQGEQIIERENEKLTSQIANFLKVDNSLQKSEIALKNSVSALAFDENSCNTDQPQTLKIAEHMVATLPEEGTLYHAVLENIDFKSVNSVLDVKEYIECNFGEDQIKVLQKISYENIYKNICLLNEHMNAGDKVLKEQKFVIYVPYNEIFGGTLKDKILVQGVIDLVIVKKDKVLLFDYKLTHKADISIKEKYQKQLDLYALALFKRFKGLPLIKHIVNLYKAKLIEMQ